MRSSMTEELEDPLIGKTFSGRFEIVASIGAGGMGRIYRAIERRLDRAVALKVLRPRFDKDSDPSYASRFFFEAQMTAKLRHPNTVTLYDYGRSEEGIYFMALELLEGSTLQQTLVKEGPLSWPRAMAIGSQVARSLREAHQLGLVHRDLKPSNIMLLPEGPLGDRVKVVDFGLVKPITSSSAARQAPASIEITDEGVVLGSPLYMAPEQARKVIDPRGDVYSLGAVLFAIISGRTPFVGKRPFDLMMKHMHEQPPELRSLVDIPPLVNALVMRCLEKAPEARFQNMDELLVAMHQAVNGLGFGGLFVTQRPGPWHSDPARKRPLDTDRPTPPVVRAPAPRLRCWARWRGALFAAAVIGGCALGAVAATTLRSGRSSAPPPALTISEVVFEITTEPAGATVLSGGERVGVTPLRLTRPLEGNAPVRLRLALVLEGHETAVVAAEGKEGLVPVHQVMTPNPLLGPGRATAVKKAGRPRASAIRSRDDPHGP